MSAAPQEFSLDRSPMKRGVTLVEASAGTGKTFSITGIVTRLLLEEDIRIEEILVVTFTEAATRELREKNRHRLALAAEQCRSTLENRPVNDPLPEMAARLKADSGKIKADLHRLEQALHDFDRAGIFTLHGFCNRMLHENAFESGIRFNVELTEDALSLREEVAEDFWRRRFYKADELEGGLICQAGFGPGELAELLNQRANRRDLVFLPPATPGGSAGQIKALAQTLEKIKEAWNREKSLYAEGLPKGTPVEHKTNKTPKKSEIKKAMERLATQDIHVIPMPGLLDAIFQIGCHRFPGAGKDSFPALCSAFHDLQSIHLRNIRHEFLDEADRQMFRLKQLRNTQTFDDLLLRLDAALRGDGAAALTQAIGQRYKAALIDEFQDTDPVQYHIFNTLFGQGRHFFFLIGDPKQSIYAFRGADIYSYLAARKLASNEYTLSFTRRPEKTLAHAVNALFTARNNPFLHPGITYQPVESAGLADKKPFTRDGQRPVTLLDVVFITDSTALPKKDGNIPPLGKEKANDFICKKAAADILALLQDSCRIDSNPISPGQIAILVRTSYQAQDIREAVEARGIPCVIRDEESVFHSAEARILGMFLAAVLEPFNDQFVKAAMATPLLGMSLPQILEIESSETKSEDWLKTFERYRETWTKCGFIVMFHQFLDEQRVRPRVLSHPQGERRLTNFLHLSELLHQAQMQQRLGPAGLLQWLDERQTDETRAPEEYTLRLDKDDDAIQVATMHKSKGLEYDVVLCPFLWESADTKRLSYVFHDEKEGCSRLAMDIEKSPSSHPKAVRENLEEWLRIFYVAVTRARHMCRLYWGHLKGQNLSTFGYLLNLYDQVNLESGEMDANVLVDALRRLNCIGLETVDINIPLPPGTFQRSSVRKDPLTARTLSRRIPDQPLVASYSAWTSRNHPEDPDRDYDLSQATPPLAPSGEGLFAFPKGGKAGDFFHELLETIPFQPDSRTPETVREMLRLHGFPDKKWTGPVCAMLDELRARPLDAAGTTGPRLEEVKPSDRLSEIPFYFPLNPFSSSDVARVFRNHSQGLEDEDFPRHMERLHFDSQSGFLKGVIDLFFQHGGRYYVLDWKSNWLGSNPGFYQGRHLREAMTRNFYILQYHLYVLASCLYLRQRMPDFDYEKHFGGVQYVFLRGIHAGHSGSGVFSQRPAPALMNELEKLLYHETR
ncbi:MAG: exodeoxyribonuclease V subunit beta [Verrucomicrobiae bacterium]|nr:exodeoxyribonuclease V subunit beta [Verrucomicrobiae bacterium]